MDQERKTEVAIIVEPVRLDELDEVADLAARVYTATFGDGMSAEELKVDLARRTADFFRKELATKNTNLLVAKYDGRIVGYVQFGYEHTPEAHATEQDRAIQQVYVDLDAQGLGIGRQLVHSALDDSEMVQAPNVFIDVWEKNIRALGLYKSFGFVEYGETAGPNPDLILIRRQHEL